MSLTPCYRCGKQLGPGALGGIETAGSPTGFLLRLGILVALVFGLTYLFLQLFSR